MDGGPESCRWRGSISLFYTHTHTCISQLFCTFPACNIIFWPSETLLWFHLMLSTSAFALIHTQKPSCDFVRCVSPLVCLILFHCVNLQPTGPYWSKAVQTTQAIRNMFNFGRRFHIGEQARLLCAVKNAAAPTLCAENGVCWESQAIWHEAVS